MLERSSCARGFYNDLSSLLLSSSEGVVRALYLRGAPYALGAPALTTALAVWSLLTILTAGAPMPLGLMIPLIVIGGCLGRLFALGMQTSFGYLAEPSIFALLGSTSVLAGSGQVSAHGAHELRIAAHSFTHRRALTHPLTISAF